MNIIEKLGITLIDRGKRTPDEDNVSVDIEDLDNLEQQNRELLEALIDMVEIQLSIFEGCECSLCVMAREKTKIIEKACYPKKWEEIKELF